MTSPTKAPTAGLSWIDSKQQEPPKDKPFWAYLFTIGIRKMRWSTAEESAEEDDGDPEDYEDCYVVVDDEDEVWTPAFWLPEDAIHEPLKVGRAALQAARGLGEG